MSLKTIYSLISMIILSFSALVFMQIKLDNTQNSNKACNRCNSPKSRNNNCEKAENEHCCSHHERWHPFHIYYCTGDKWHSFVIIVEILNHLRRKRLDLFTVVPSYDDFTAHITVAEEINHCICELFNIIGLRKW